MRRPDVSSSPPKAGRVKWQTGAPNLKFEIGQVRSAARTRSLKPVVQLERTGCGIASVAALAGVSYKTAQESARRLGIVATDVRLWSGTEHVRRLLERYGLRAQTRKTPFVSWSAMPDRALLAVKWQRRHGRPAWHWVVFVREHGRAVVLDSAASLKRHARTDLGRITPKWFIGVQTTASRTRQKR